MCRSQVSICTGPTGNGACRIRSEGGRAARCRCWARPSTADQEHPQPFFGRAEILFRVQRPQDRVGRDGFVEARHEAAEGGSSPPTASKNESVARAGRGGVLTSSFSPDGSFLPRRLTADGPPPALHLIVRPISAAPRAVECRSMTGYRSTWQDGRVSAPRWQPVVGAGRGGTVPDALVLNATYEPLCVVPLRRAVVLVLAEKATVLETGDAVLHSERLAVPAPAWCDSADMFECPTGMPRRLPGGRCSSATGTAVPTVPAGQRRSTMWSPLPWRERTTGTTSSPHAPDATIARRTGC